VGDGLKDAIQGKYPSFFECEANSFWKKPRV